MTANQSHPPKLALWLLRHLCHGQHSEALTGDMVERFQEGATANWFWRQTLLALAMGAVGSVRRHWMFFAYAAAGTIVMSFLRPGVRFPIARWLHWSDLPWPLSQFVFELATPALISLSTLAVLATGLIIEHSFRWVALVRTGIVNVALLALNHSLPDLFPWLLRPVPGEPYHKVMILPGFVQVVILASTFLVAAWLGCRVKAEHDPSLTKSANAE